MNHNKPTNTANTLPQFGKPTLLSVAICAVLASISSTAYADDETQEATTTDSVPTVVLDTDTIVVKKRISRKDNEVTGLGKVVKSIQDIDDEQILGIRDLTRYDPGISVVEQGRGATSGYAMRGVDKNRVALLVDDLPQAQSYTTLFSKANGGAINEIEYENIRGIELSKGSSSSDYGNGALGGAVGFATKEPNDIIKQDKNWGLNTKTAYSSKNGQLTNSIAAAARQGGFEAMAIYTHRDGHETAVHKDATSHEHTITRLSGYADVYDMRLGTAQNAYSNGWFIIKDECPTLDCTPKPSVSLTRDTLPTLRTHPPLSELELANRQSMLHPSETLTADAYTGSERIMPDPMDYQSDSLLLKSGYRFSPEHYVGGVYEHTKQQYNIQDMSVPAYYLPEENANGARVAHSVYANDQLLNGLRLNYTNLPASLNWTRTQFFDEEHRKTRAGVFYQFDHQNSGIIDKLKLAYNRQSIELDSTSHDRRCAPYPTVDANCRASTDKPWSYYKSEKNGYSEQIDQLDLNLHKAFEFAKSSHKLQLSLGAQKQQSTLKRSDYMHEYAEQTWQSVRDGLSFTPNGSYDRPYVYSANPTAIVRADLCDYSGNSADLSDCSARQIDGKNYHIAIKDTIAFGKFADLGLGLRYDTHRYSSNDDWTATGNYRNWSWNAGLTLKPTDYLALSYRISSGFRVPAFYEMFGRRVQGSQKDTSGDFHHIGQFKPEKSLNQEFGIGLKGDFGYLETSYFYNRYKDMIALAELRGLTNNQFGYHNIQDVSLHGINVLGKVDWHSVHKAIPEGWYSSLAYNQVKVKERNVNPNFTNTSDPLLDAIQPARLVAGLGYDHPNGVWGVSATSTYSKAKRDDELTGVRYVGNTAYNANNQRTRHWYTHDINGYVNLSDNVTLRAGVYNLFNRKYSTWEAVRQSSANTVNLSARQSASFAAPDRNFVVSLEMKF